MMTEWSLDEFIPKSQLRYFSIMAMQISSQIDEDIMSPKSVKVDAFTSKSFLRVCYYA